MITLTTLDKRKIYLNPHLIEQIESVPETVLTLTNGKKILICETPQIVAQKVAKYNRSIYGPKRMKTF
ncbi:flagellar FlbD family protein [Bacillota bacterium LX-D]|nr:flagellar FlbD family protein [Bacillota bacterium LX-D]